MADAANKYVIALSPHITLERDTRQQSFQYKALTCFERIGDYAINVNDSAVALHEMDGTFSALAVSELEVVFSALDEILDMCRKAYKNDDVETASRIEALEEAIDDLIDVLQDNHTQRMVRNECKIYNGIQLQNILQNLERISDQCSDLAVSLLSFHNDEIRGLEHAYIYDLHHSNNPSYIRDYESKRDHYLDIIRDINSRAGNPLPTEQA